MKSLLILPFLLWTLPAFALKPTTVLSKVVANNGGSKALIIKRTVHLKDENITCNETWSISHADAMKLDVTGTNADNSKWSFEVLYKGGQRQTTSVEGKVKSFPLSPEFFEPLLHFRSLKALQSKLTTMQVLPPTEMPPESYMNIDRHKGTIVLALGATETKNTQQPPRVWVEQNNFVLRKVRLGSQVEVEFDNFKDYDEGKIKQPETQTVYWKNSTVTIQNISVQVVDQSKVASALKIQKGDQAKLPENANLKEFYSRFR